MKDILAIVFGVIALCAISFMIGRQSMQNEIEKRANKTNNIELIIFGEKQL